MTCRKAVDARDNLCQVRTVRACLPDRRWPVALFVWGQPAAALRTPCTGTSAGLGRGRAVRYELLSECHEGGHL